MSYILSLFFICDSHLLFFSLLFFYWWLGCVFLLVFFFLVSHLCFFCSFWQKCYCFNYLNGGQLSPMFCLEWVTSAFYVLMWVCLYMLESQLYILRGGVPFYSNWLRDSYFVDRAQEGGAQTSASEEITDVPASLSEFCQQLRNRITQQSIPTLSSENHETLVSHLLTSQSQDWKWAL